MDVHVAEAVDPDRLHGVKVPASVEESETVPVGVTNVPEFVSVTVTVHVEVCPTVTGVVQETVVEVVRTTRVDRIVKLPVLPVWMPSPP